MLPDPLWGLGESGLDQVLSQTPTLPPAPFHPLPPPVQLSSSCPQPPRAAPQGQAFPLTRAAPEPPGRQAPGNPPSSPNLAMAQLVEPRTTRKRALPLGFPQHTEWCEGPIWHL